MACPTPRARQATAGVPATGSPNAGSRATPDAPEATARPSSASTPDNFVHELVDDVDSIVGDNYPDPTACCATQETIVRIASW